jgi:four helix bundle protein
MAKINRFEDIEAWKTGRELVRNIYRVTAAGSFARDHGLRDQIRRAALSVISNIAEGFERRGEKEFAHFLGQARGSCGEVRCQLYVAFDLGYVTTPEFDSLHRLCDSTGRQLTGLLRYLRSRAPS